MGMREANSSPSPCRLPVCGPVRACALTHATCSPPLRGKPSPLPTPSREAEQATLRTPTGVMVLWSLPPGLPGLQPWDGLGAGRWALISSSGRKAKGRRFHPAQADPGAHGAAP